MLPPRANGAGGAAGAGDGAMTGCRAGAGAVGGVARFCGGFGRGLSGGVGADGGGGCDDCDGRPLLRMLSIESKPPVERCAVSPAAAAAEPARRISASVRSFSKSASVSQSSSDIMWEVWRSVAGVSARACRGCRRRRTSGSCAVTSTPSSPPPLTPSRKQQHSRLRQAPSPSSPSPATADPLPAVR